MSSALDLLEQHSQIIYPVLAALAVILMVLGIVSAWRDHDLAGATKTKIKRQMFFELRKRGGASAEELARVVGLEPLRVLKLLEEMQDDGLLLSHTNTQRLTLWRIKGLT